MPVISKFQTQNRIDQRVQSGQITESGSAVARSLAAIGGEAANFANKLLLERKEHQARTFSQKKVSEKSMERQQLYRELTRENVLDPSDGTINDPSSDYHGMELSAAMGKWEAQRTDELKREAPTELAGRYFELSENPRAEKSALQAEQYQNQVIVGNWSRLNEERNDNRAKSALSHVSISETHAQFGTGLIEDMERDADESRMVDPLTKENLKIRNGNKIANASYRSMLVDEQYENMLSNLEMGKLLKARPELKKEIIDDFVSSGVPITDVMFLKDGRMVFTGEKRGMKTDWRDGDGKKVEASFVEAQRIKETKPIEIKGTFKEPEENKLLKYITPDEQYGLAKQAARGMAGKYKKSLVALQSDHKNLLSGFQSIDDTLKLRKSSPAHNEALQGHLKKIMLSPLDPSRKKEMLVETFAAVNYGEIMDGLWDASPEIAQRDIDQIPSKIRKSFKDLGMEKMAYDDPLFAKAVTTKVSGQLKQQYNAMRKDQGTIEYQIKNSNISAKLEANKYRSPEAYRAAKARRDDLYDRMKVPLSQRADFSDAEISEAAARFEGAIENRNLPGTIEAMRQLDQKISVMENSDDAYELLDKLRESGVKSNIGPALLFDSSTMEGTMAQNKAFTNAIEEGDINQSFDDLRVKEGGALLSNGAVRGMVRNQLSDVNLALNNRFSIGGSKRVNDMVGLITTEAKRMYTKKEAETMDEAVKNATDFYLKKNFSTVRKGNTSVIIPNAQLKSAGYDVDPKTGESNTLNKVVKTYSNPRNIPYGGVYSWENDPVIKDSLDQLKLVGDARQKKLMEMLEDGAWGGMMIIHTPKGFNFAVGNNGAQSVLVDKDGNPLTVPLDIAKQDPKVTHEDTAMDMVGKGLDTLFELLVK